MCFLEPATQFLLRLKKYLTDCDGVHRHIHTSGVIKFIHTQLSERRSTLLPLKLSHDSGIPFYRQVEDQLRQLIKSGQLEEGARLPSVRELARELMVSLITVRRSYADLEKEGWIIRKQGQGTFVAEVSSASLQEEVREEEI